ncbi:MAG: hypothetical protein ACWGNB_10240 [Thiogranum sp.]
MARGDNFKGKPSAGRPKGAKNKTSVAVKTAILAALEADGDPEQFFIELRRNDPKTFAHLFGRLIPAEWRPCPSASRTLRHPPRLAAMHAEIAVSARGRCVSAHRCRPTPSFRLKSNIWRGLIMETKFPALLAPHNRDESQNTD